MMRCHGTSGRLSHLAQNGTVSSSSYRTYYSTAAPLPATLPHSLRVVLVHVCVPELAADLELVQLHWCTPPPNRSCTVVFFPH